MAIPVANTFRGLGHQLVTIVSIELVFENKKEGKNSCVGVSFSHDFCSKALIASEV